MKLQPSMITYHQAQKRRYNVLTPVILVLAMMCVWLAGEVLKGGL